MSRRVAVVAASVLVVTVLSCADGGGHPVEAPVMRQAVVSVVLASTATDDGAILLTIDGPSIGDVEAARNDLIVFSHRPGGTRLDVAVFGHNLSGALLTMTVPDVSRIDGYSLTVGEVAGPDNQLRSDLEGYRLSLVPR